MPDRDPEARSEAVDGAFQSIVDRHERGFQTVGGMVYDIIREGILSGAFAPGERLRQDRLADAIGVSRIPVRSALLQLEAMGLITFDPNGAAVIRSLTIDEMREIYEIRALLESHALRNASSSMTPERLDHLDELARALNEIGDGEEFLARRTAFYRELYDGYRQPQLVNLIEQLRTDAARYWLHRHVEYVRGPGRRDHQEVLELLRRGDEEGALLRLREHLERVGEELVALMQKDEQGPG